MGRFASSTDVSSSKSRMEIEQILDRYGASHFMYGSAPGRAIIGFEAKGRRIKFELPMPDRSAREFTHTPATDKARSATAAADAYEQAVRQRWRALCLCIKAKLESIECEISTFDQEFMAFILLPNGKTVGEQITKGIDKAYESGQVGPLMLALEGPR